MSFKSRGKGLKVLGVVCHTVDGRQALTSQSTLTFKLEYNSYLCDYLVITDIFMQNSVRP